MNLTPTFFRSAVVLQFAIGFLMNADSQLFPGRIPEAVKAADAEATAPLMASLQSFIGSPYFVFLYLGVVVLMVALVASCYGLLRFKRWARPLSLVLFLGLSVALPLPMHHIQSGLDQSLTLLQAFLSGAIIAMAYFSPIALRFEERRSTPAAHRHPPGSWAA